MSIKIELDLDARSEVGKEELRKVAAGLLAMAGEHPYITVGENGGLTVHAPAGSGGIASPTATPSEIANIVSKLPHQHVENFNAVELANDPAQLTPRAGDVNPANVGFGNQTPPVADQQPNPATIGFGGSAPTPVVPTPPVITLPSVPSPPAAPVPPVPGTPAAGGVERDKRGVVWDARVHSGNKAVNKDGSWKAKRGADQDLLKQVESQYLAGAQQQQQQQQAMSPVVALMSKIGNLIIGDANPSGILTTEQLTEILKTEVGVDGTIGLMQRPDLVPYATQIISQRIGRPL